MTPLEKLDVFLQLDEEEMASMSSEEIREELLYLGVNVQEMTTNIKSSIAEALKQSRDDESTVRLEMR